MELGFFQPEAKKIWLGKVGAGQSQSQVLP